LDEVFLTINGERHHLWRAVDQDGNVLDILVQRRRNKTVAKKFFRKLLKRCQYVPRVIITDKRKSYGAAKQEMLPGVEHRQHRYLNNRAENAHQPPRPTGAAHATVQVTGAGPAHPLGVCSQRATLPPATAPAVSLGIPLMSRRFESWAEIAGTERAA
jgi:putative transposase